MPAWVVVGGSFTNVSLDWILYPENTPNTRGALHLSPTTRAVSCTNRKMELIKLGKLQKQARHRAFSRAQQQGEAHDNNAHSDIP
jgi:hypothetical protein